MLHTYRAKSIQQAIAKVRDELGLDARIVYTREVRAGRLFSRRTEVEVVARREEQENEELPAEPSRAFDAFTDQLLEVGKE